MNTDRESLSSTDTGGSTHSEGFLPNSSRFNGLSEDVISQIKDEEIQDLVRKLNEFMVGNRPSQECIELVNPGEAESQPQETRSVPFVDPTHLASMRNTVVIFCAIALASEVSDYPIFQVLATQKSYMIAGVPLTPAWVMALIFGGIFDTYVNVRSENVANDAFETALALFEPNALPQSMMALLRISQLSSLISFVGGSCGNFIGLMAGISFVLGKAFPHAESQAHSFYLLIYRVSIAVSAFLSILPGVAYYAVFNIGKFKKSFEMFLDFSYADTRDLTLSKARTWACMLEALNVVIFRSISFAAIVGEALKIFFGPHLDKNIALSLVCIVFVATAISVLSTRVIQVIDHYTKDEYLFLNAADIHRARDALTLSTYFRGFCMKRNFWVALVSSFGLGWLLKDFSGMESPLMLAVNCIAPMMMFLTYMVAEHDKAVLEAALDTKRNHAGWKSSLDESKKQRKFNCMNKAFSRSALNQPLVDRADVESDVKAKGKDLSDEAFKLISKRFEDDPWIKYGVPVCVALQVFLARGISFLTFAETLKTYVPVEFDSIALFLLAGPINMLNWYDMFHSGVKATLLSHRVESYIIYCKDVAEEEAPPLYYEWHPVSYYDYYRQLFVKGLVDYDVADVQRALQRIDKAPPRLEDYSSVKLFRSVKSWVVSDSQAEGLLQPEV